MRRSRLPVVVMVVLVASAAAAGVASAAGLPEVTSGKRPGPDALYAPAPPTPPQLRNAGPWQADPILVSGATAYRDGEFLYQDFLYDDHGAVGAQDPTDPFNGVEFLFSPKHGTLTYPTDQAFANNAADLVELRVRRVAGATAFRVTLNHLADPARTAFTVALGDSAVARPWPHGAGVSSPAALFLTVHGTTAELVDATTGVPRGPAPTASVAADRRQIDVRVPTAAWNPGTGGVRMAAGVGLWDPARGAYAAPNPGPASATTPGGAAPSRAALFNVAFRTAEPLPQISNPGVANTIAEGGAGVDLDGTWWRERAQADALAAGDVSRFSASVDFGKLAAGSDDDAGVPRSGHLNRIFVSRSEFGPGVDHDRKCFVRTDGGTDPCTGRFLGRLQPYAVYVPRKAPPPSGYGLTLLMHGLSANHNEFLGSRNAEQFGERATGSIVASPLGRGPDGFYKEHAEADVFEMWADVARNYRLDPEYAAASGYSMGGQGTYRLAVRWPDLFARVFPIVGPATDLTEQFASLRNVPVMAWYAANDELVGLEMSEPVHAAAVEAGIRYDHWLFAPAGHITLGNNDEYGPAAAFLGGHKVDRDPPHVTYVVDPAEDTAPAGTADHAYWLSGLRVRDRDAEPTATIDARSRARGVGDAPVLPEQTGAGTLEGGSHGPLPYNQRTRSWGAAPRTAKANRLDLTATNLATATIAMARAGLGCDADVRVTTDGPLTLRLDGCDQTVRVAKGTSRVGCVSRRSFMIHLPRRMRGRRVTRARVTVAGRRVQVTRRGGRLRARVNLRGRRSGRYTVRIVAYTRGGKVVRSKRAYRTCAKKRGRRR